MPRLIPPEHGLVVRMYRQGHGDCFLLATRKADDSACYVLIDCGLKAGSELANGPKIAEVVADIAEATDGFIDVVAITHEHEDHVTGFLATDASGQKSWDGIRIGECWLAWTEDADDDLANELRAKFGDTLVALMGALGPLRAEVKARFGAEVGALLGADRPEHVRGATEVARAALVEALLETELGRRDGLDEPPMAMGAEAFAISRWKLKDAIKYIRDKASDVRFLRPDAAPIALPGTGGFKVYALGPPRDETLLLSLDPRSDEEFKLADAEGAELRGFMAAAAPAAAEAGAGCPFAPRHGLPLKPKPPLALARGDRGTRDFFDTHYAGKDDDWRRIDADWAGLAETLALRLNSEVNNTSLVLAFELPNTGKVLLFTGDAQRGSWISWADLAWEDAGGRVTAQELLGRAVFYKVGHHGSHNATLKGTLDSPHPNLSWLARPPFEREFVAMIPSNEDWARAIRPYPWRHPLAAIAEALEEKALGKVLQTNKGVPARPSLATQAEWQAFEDRLAITANYIEIVIPDPLPPDPPPSASVCC